MVGSPGGEQLDPPTREVPVHGIGDLGKMPASPMPSLGAEEVECKAASAPGSVNKEKQSLRREVIELRQRTEKQEMQLSDYRAVAESMVQSGDADGPPIAGGMNAQMLRVWLRDARSQSDELRALFEQSQQVAREGNALLKKDLEAQAARHRAASEKMAAHADSLQARCSALESSLRDAAEWASHVETERDRLEEERDRAIMARGRAMEEAASARDKCAMGIEAARAESARIVEENASLRERMKEQAERADAVEEAARRASETANKDLRSMLDKANDLRERERCNFEGLMADKERELEAAEGSAERWRMAEEGSKRLVASLERDGDAREERCWAKVERVGEGLGRARYMRKFASSFRAWSGLCYSARRLRGVGYSMLSARARRCASLCFKMWRQEAAQQGVLARAQEAAAESLVEGKAKDWARRTLSGWRLRVEHIRWVQERAGRIKRDGSLSSGVVFRIWHGECRRGRLARRRGERAGDWRADGLVAKFAIEGWRLHVDREIFSREATIECKNERDGFEEECRGLREGLAALTDALKISKSVNRVKEREIERLQWGGAQRGADTPEKRRVLDTEGLRDVERSVSILREELASSKDKVMRLESELEVANEAKCVLEEALDALRSELDDRLRGSEEALRECEGRVARGQAAWMEERVGLDEKMDLLADRANRAEAEIEAVAGDRDSLADERDALLDEKKNLASERDGVQAALDAARGERDALSSELGQVQQRLDLVSSELLDAEARHGVATSELEALHAGELQEAVAVHREELRKVESKCRQRMDEERGGIQAEVKAGERGAREEVMRLESELGSSSEKVTRLEGELGALKEEVVRLEGDCMRLEGERVEGTRAARDLDRRLSSLKAQLEALSTENSVLSEENNDLQKQRAQAVSESNSLRRERDALRFDAEAQNKEKERAEAEARRQREELVKRVGHLEAEKVSMQQGVTRRVRGEGLALTAGRGMDAKILQPATPVAHSSSPSPRHILQERKVGSPARDDAHVETPEEASRREAEDAARAAAEAARLEEERKAAVASILSMGSKGLATPPRTPDIAGGGARESSTTPIVNAKKAALSDMRSKMMAMRRPTSTTPTAASADGKKVEELGTPKTKGRTGADDSSMDDSRDEGDAIADTVFSRRTAVGGVLSSPSN